MNTQLSGVVAPLIHVCSIVPVREILGVRVKSQNVLEEELSLFGLSVRINYKEDDTISSDVSALGFGLL